MEKYIIVDSFKLILKTLLQSPLNDYEILAAKTYTSKPKCKSMNRGIN